MSITEYYPKPNYTRHPYFWKPASSIAVPFDRCTNDCRSFSISVLTNADFFDYQTLCVLSKTVLMIAEQLQVPACWLPYCASFRSSYYAICKNPYCAIVKNRTLPLLKFGLSLFYYRQKGNDESMNQVRGLSSYFEWEITYLSHPNSQVRLGPDIPSEWNNQALNILLIYSVISNSSWIVSTLLRYAFATLYSSLNQEHLQPEEPFGNELLRAT